MSSLILRGAGLLVLLPGLALALTACQEASPESDELHAASLQGEKVVAQFFEAFNARDLDTLEGLLAETVMYGDEQLERNEYLEVLQMTLAAFPDAEARVTSLVSNDDQTVARVAYDGTGEGEYFGHDIDGKEVEWTNSYWFDIAEGRIEGYVYNWDELQFWTQLGVIESPYPEE